MQPYKVQYIVSNLSTRFEEYTLLLDSYKS